MDDLQKSRIRVTAQLKKAESVVQAAKAQLAVFGQIEERIRAEANEQTKQGAITQSSGRAR
jgi:hypothetical protein